MSKITVESTKRISVFWLRKNGYLKPDSYHYGGISWSYNGEPSGNINFLIDTENSASYNPFIRFIYRTKPYYEDEWKDMDYKFDLISIPCRYGGKRWYFKCGLYRGGVY